MSFLKKYADNTSYNSVSNQFRRKRFKHFLELINPLTKPIKILDIGGTANFWIQMQFAGSDVAEITLYNIETENIHDPRFKFMHGDAKDLSMFRDKEFDVVFSNSVIEHVGNLHDQKKMADEALRTGKLCMIQTPNYYFPFEPHFMFPFFQFFPRGFKKYLIQNFSLGWFSKAQSPHEADSILNSVNLLKAKDLNFLFPGCTILKEKFIFLTKSYIIISNPDSQTS